MIRKFEYGYELQQDTKAKYMERYQIVIVI